MNTLLRTGARAPPAARLRGLATTSDGPWRAQKLDGKVVADKVLDGVRRDVEELRKSHGAKAVRSPWRCYVLREDDDASSPTPQK